MAGYLLILSLTADRYMVVRFPLRAADWSSGRHASLVTGFIFAASFLYAAPYYVWGRQNKGYACVFVGSGNVYATYYMWSVVLFGLVLPFACVSYMNAVIIVTIRDRLQYRGKCPTHSRMPVAYAASTSISGNETTVTSGIEDDDDAPIAENQVTRRAWARNLHCLGHIGTAIT